MLKFTPNSDQTLDAPPSHRPPLLSLVSAKPSPPLHGSPPSNCRHPTARWALRPIQPLSAVGSAPPPPSSPPTSASSPPATRSSLSPPAGRRPRRRRRQRLPPDNSGLANLFLAPPVERPLLSPPAASRRRTTKAIDFEQAPSWKKFLAHVRPGFLVSLAYLDPGSLETDLQAGANHIYELLWVVLIGLIFALIIQSLAANLGVTTGRHLAELCKAEYPMYVKLCPWLLAELAVIHADIPKVIGTAFALNILFHIPVWIGVLINGLSTLLLLGLLKYGVRKLELLISILVFVMAACYFGELSYVKPPAAEVMKGLFIPKLNGSGATGDAIALVMPHNLFLHSALVLSRKTPASAQGINNACRYFLLESGFALFIALLINIAVI